MNNLQLLQSTNLMDIMSLGNDISDKLKSNTKQTLQIMDEVLKTIESATKVRGE